MKLVEPLAQSPDFVAEAGPTTWGVAAVGAPHSPFTGAGVTVAVLDTGIDATHPAFAGVQLVQRDFTSGGSANDTNGHGTHCAGTIFGRDVGGLRIGVATGVTKALIGKVLGGPAGGGSDILSEAIIWAADNGANVVSMSLGIDFPGWVEELVNNNGFSIPVATSIALEQYRANIRLFEQLSNLLAARAAVAQTVVVTAASGNESGRDETPPFEINVAPPAASTGIVAVGAVGQGQGGLRIAPFSNTRATVAAPGVDVTSAKVGGGTSVKSGTSMATPHVAGIAALWAEKLAQQGPLNPVLLQAKLIGSATLAGLAPNTDSLDVGAGLVQAPAA
jgi:subtilisin family serine protease